MASAKDSQADDDGQTYFWSPSGDNKGGSWNVASNWLVGASETPAAVAPGPDDSVFINTTAQTKVGSTYINGTGYSHDLTIGPYVDLEGAFYTQIFSVADSDPTQDVSQIASGGSLETATASIAGSFDISGSLQVAGLLEQQGDDIPNSSSLFVENGGSLQVGALEIDNLGGIDVDGSSTVEVGTSATARVGYISVGSGVALEMTGESSIEGKVWNDGVIEINDPPYTPFYENHPTISIDADPGFLSGSGSVQIDSNSSLTLFAENGPTFFSGTIDTTQEIHFSGPNSTLCLVNDYVNSSSATVTNIVGFETSDEILLGQLMTSYSYSYTTDEDGDATIQVDLDDNGQTTTDVLTLKGQYTGAQFRLIPGTNPSDGQSVLIITETVACFCPGTLIEAEVGEIPVEKLQIGDRVRTAGGLLKPVLWIGRRSYDRRFAVGKASLQPIRIRAGALGKGLPRRDLLVSPKHAMLVQDVLVPAELLVNGMSILQEQQPGDVHYLHIELEHHDLLLAEGAAAESFVDDNSRGMFHNAGEYAQLYPNRLSTEPVWCAPCVEDGQKLVAAQSYLDALAGISPAEALPPVHGYLDDATPDGVRGWAWCAAHPYAPVLLDVLLDGVLVRQVLADRFRRDLAAAGIGAGCHSFEFTLPEAPPGSVITVHRALDGQALVGLDKAA